MNRLFLALLLVFPVDLYARVKIYLIPQVEIEKKSISLSDIAKIEGGDIKRAGSLIIPEVLYKDMILDRRELNDFLAELMTETFVIFGSGVKLVFIENENSFPEAIDAEKIHVIKKGDPVELVIRKKGIVIEMKGRALQSGTGNDEIDIKLNNGKIVRGKPVGAGKVAVHL